MFHLRRAAARTFSSQTSAVLSKPTSLFTQTPAALRQRQQWQLPSFQRRFASEEASATQAQTSGETVTTDPSQPEIEAKEEATEHMEKQADSRASGLPKTAEEAVETVKDKFQRAASSAASTARSAADSVLGGRSRRDDVGTFGEPKPSKILYVGNLFFEVKAPELEREFTRHGEVVNCRIVEDERGLSKGFGYVEFGTIDSATTARDALNQKVFQGRRLAVQYHVRREPRANRSVDRNNRAPTKTLFIGNMSFQMSDKDLNDLFRDVKNVIDVRVAIDRRSGQPRGFAHADFIDVASAEAAKEALDNKDIYGRKLRIDYSHPASGRGEREVEQ